MISQDFTKNLFKAFILLLFSFSLQAQSAKPKNADDKEQPFFTGISPVVLAKDAVEISFLNSLTSFWLVAHQYDPVLKDTRITNRYRYSRLDQLLRVSYGFSKNKKWDLGAEFRFAHLRLDDEARSSPFRVLSGNTTSGNTYRGLTTVGLRARAMPFEGIPELTLQATTQFPMIRTDTLRQRLNAQRSQVGLGATYYVQVSPATYYFFQVDWSTLLSNNELNRTTHLVSGSTYLVIDTWESMWYIMPSLTYGMSLQGNNGTLRRINQQFLGGVGVLFQSSAIFSILLNAQIPFILDSGSSNTEWDRRSYSSVTIGLRTAF